MISHPLAPLLSPCQPSVIHHSTSDTPAPLEIHGLEDACGVLGGTHAWVMRHNREGCQLVNHAGSFMEIDSTLNDLLVQSAQSCHERPVLVMRWKEDTLMCARLSTQQEAEGCTYMLCMLFDGQFELTSRLAGFVDGLRCSLQALIKWQLSKQKVQWIQTSEMHAISCTCCHRIHSFEHGWMHSDNPSQLKGAHGNSRTVCEKCALALYSEALQD